MSTGIQKLVTALVVGLVGVVGLLDLGPPGPDLPS